MTPVWEETEDAELGLSCSGTPHCSFCYVFMEGMTATPHTFLLDESKKDERSYAIDVDTRCPECGSIETFGVAITEKHYFSIINKAKMKRKETW